MVATPKKTLIKKRSNIHIENFVNRVLFKQASMAAGLLFSVTYEGHVAVDFQIIR